MADLILMSFLLILQLNLNPFLLWPLKTMCNWWRCKWIPNERQLAEDEGDLPEDQHSENEYMHSKEKLKRCNNVVYGPLCRRMIHRRQREGRHLTQKNCSNTDPKDRIYKRLARKLDVCDSCQAEYHNFRHRFAGYPPPASSAGGYRGLGQPLAGQSEYNPSAEGGYRPDLPNSTAPELMPSYTAEPPLMASYPTEPPAQGVIATPIPREPYGYGSDIRVPFYGDIPYEWVTPQTQSAPDDTLLPLSHYETAAPYTSTTNPYVPFTSRPPTIGQSSLGGGPGPQFAATEGYPSSGPIRYGMNPYEQFTTNDPLGYSGYQDRRERLPPASLPPTTMGILTTGMEHLGLHPTAGSSSPWAPTPLQLSSTSSSSSGTPDPSSTLQRKEGVKKPSTKRTRR